MKTIFITSFHSLISRNILQTEVFLKLKEENVRIVLLVPQKKTGYFKKFFGGKNVFVEGIQIPKKPFEKALYFISIAIVGMENHLLYDFKEEGKYIKFYSLKTVHILFHRFFFVHRFMRFIARTYLRTSAFDEVFEKYKPDLIFTTDSFHPEDRALLVEGKRRGVRRVGMIRSWDNPTTKGVLLSVPDAIIVHNEFLKEELHSIHRISRECITITGIPHYDAVLQERALTREAFYKELGLDTQKHTILFAPGGKMLYQHDDGILKLLKQAKDAGRFILPVQFLVRFPPADTLDISPIEDDEDFIIDNPGVNLTGKKKESELSPDDGERLNCSLAYSDVVITIVSTIINDAAAFDRPTIVWSIDPLEKPEDPIDKFKKWVHFKKLLATDFCTVAEDMDMFVEQVNEYLQNPEKDTEKRNKLVARCCYKLDGKASNRVFQVLAEHLKENSYV